MRRIRMAEFAAINSSADENCQAAPKTGAGHEKYEPHNISMQRTPLRASADAERWACRFAPDPSGRG